MFSAFLLSANAAAADDLNAVSLRTVPPAIAIIIDDLGHQSASGRRAVRLPGPVACAFLPHTPFGPELAGRAYANGKEVLLHLPMQAANSHNDYALGPGALRLDTSRAEFSRTLTSNLESVPHAVGVNNHMGSLLTRHPGHMAWLMEDLKQAGTGFFIDSQTHSESVALRVADEAGMPAARRDVFLDRDPSADAVERQFRKLKEIAARRGYAIAIGHPNDTTLSLLERELPRLYYEGYRLVKVSEIIEQRQLAEPSWQQVSSSPLQRDLKK